MVGDSLNEKISFTLNRSYQQQKNFASIDGLPTPLSNLPEL